MSLHFNFYASQLFCLFLFSQINLLVAIFLYTQMLDFILRSPTLQNSSFLVHLLFGELVKEIPCKSTWPVNETNPQFMQNIRITYYARKNKRNIDILLQDTIDVTRKYAQSLLEILLLEYWSIQILILIFMLRYS